MRGSAIEAVLLTDGELDHVTGLLSLREHRDLRLVCSRAVKDLLTQQFPLLPVLQHYCQVRVSDFPVRIGLLRISAIDVGSKAPPYARKIKRRELVQGLKFESPAGKLAYLPGLEKITPAVEKFIGGCDCLLVDGTFWSDREMISLGLSKRTARDMGHVSIDGPSGSLAWLQRLTIPRKVYIHINNTNPILRKKSPERRAVERAGIEVAHDGMEISL